MNNSTTSVIIFIIGAFLTAISQTLLKVSANKSHDSQVKEYFNPLVITSYAILAFTLCINIIGYQWIEYKYGSVINCLSYVFIMFLGFGFLKEKLTLKKVVGNVLIVIGIIVFTLF